MVRTQILPDPSNEHATWTYYYCSDDCVEQAFEAQGVFDSEPDEAVACDYCEKNIAVGGGVTPATYHVNAYETHDVYGGPEEGGWWYTVGVPTGESWGPFATVEEAWDRQAALDENAATYNEGRWPRNSSNGGDWYALYVESHGPKAFPKETPRYE